MAVSDRIAVMNRGAIVQEGTAEDLYHRPASEFVARFIGRVNFLTGCVLAATPGSVELDVAGARVRLATALAPLAVGGDVRLVLRPEAVRLHPAGSGSGLAGTVTSRTFLGEKVEYEVRVGTEVLQVTRYDAAREDPFGAGRAVAVELPPGGVHLIPGPAS